MENNNTVFTAADLPIVKSHLSITAEQLAPNIILVGDPDRVPHLADTCLAKDGRIDVYRRGLTFKCVLKAFKKLNELNTVPGV